MGPRMQRAPEAQRFSRQLDRQEVSCLGGRPAGPRGGGGLQHICRRSHSRGGPRGPLTAGPHEGPEAAQSQRASPLAVQRGGGAISGVMSRASSAGWLRDTLLTVRGMFAGDTPPLPPEVPVGVTCQGDEGGKFAETWDTRGCLTPHSTPLAHRHLVRRGA